MLSPSLWEAVNAELDAIDARARTRGGRALSEAYRLTPERPRRPVDIDPVVWRAAYLELRFPSTVTAIADVGARLAGVADLSHVTSLLDLGCGPGSAVHALQPLLPALRSATLVDTDEGLLDMAERLAAQALPSHVAITTEARDIADAHGPAPADLVVLAYALGELVPRDRPRAVERAWLNARQALILIEPGTSPGFARVLDARRVLLARGARIVAPCPHQRACPMTEPDWCHLPVRVERSRRMRQVKRGDLGYEDEAICYLIATRQPPLIDTTLPRIVGRPRIEKNHVRLPLCTIEGLETRAVVKRDGAWRAARRARWGDAWNPDARTGSDEDPHGIDGEGHSPDRSERSGDDVE